MKSASGENAGRNMTLAQEAADVSAKAKQAEDDAMFRRLCERNEQLHQAEKANVWLRVELLEVMKKNEQLREQNGELAASLASPQYAAWKVLKERLGEVEKEGAFLKKQLFGANRRIAGLKGDLTTQEEKCAAKMAVQEARHKAEMAVQEARHKAEMERLKAVNKILTKRVLGAKVAAADQSTQTPDGAVGAEREWRGMSFESIPQALEEEGAAVALGASGRSWRQHAVEGRAGAEGGDIRRVQSL